MELRHLRYFIAAAEEEHFGRASDRMFVTRPAISQIVADLEDELGVPLFERLPHRVKLTAAGLTLLPRLQAIMSELNQALVLTKRVGAGKSGALNVGYGSLSLRHPLFRASVKRFIERYPDVTLSLSEIVTFEQRKAIIDGKIHAGFMFFGPKSVLGRQPGKGKLPPDGQNALDHFVIQSCGLGVVMPYDHPLATRKSISIKDLVNEHFVVVPSSSVNPGLGLIFSMCQKEGFEPNIVQEVRSNSILLNLVSVGVGIGLAVMGKHFTYPEGLVVVKLKDVSYKTTFELGWLKDSTDPVLDQFIDIVKELANSAELEESHH